MKVTKQKNGLNAIFQVQNQVKVKEMKTMQEIRIADAIESNWTGLKCCVVEKFISTQNVG